MTAMANESSGLIDMKVLMEAARTHGAPVRAEVRNSLELAFDRPLPLCAAAYPVLVAPELAATPRTPERSRVVIASALAAVAVALLAVAGTLAATSPRAPAPAARSAPATPRVVRSTPPVIDSAPVAFPIVVPPAPVAPPVIEHPVHAARPHRIHAPRVPVQPVATPEPPASRDPSQPRTLEELMNQALR